MPDVRVMVPATVVALGQERPDLSRIGTDHPFRGLLDGLNDQLDIRAAVGLTDPNQSGIGLDFDDRAGQPPQTSKPPCLWLGQRHRYHMDFDVGSFTNELLLHEGQGTEDE